MYKFKESNGALHLMDENNIITGYLALSFCFDTTTGTLMRYGEQETVEAWHKGIVKKYNEAGVEDAAKDLIVITNDSWDEKLVNRFLDTSGYIGYWWKKHNRKENEISMNANSPSL